MSVYAYRQRCVAATTAVAAVAAVVVDVAAVIVLVVAAIVVVVDSVVVVVAAAIVVVAVAATTVAAAAARACRQRGASPAVAVIACALCQGVALRRERVQSVPGRITVGVRPKSQLCEPVVTRLTQK